MTGYTLTPKATIFSVMVNQIKMSAGIELHKSCHVILKNYLVAADHLTRTNSFHSRTKMVFLLAPWKDQMHHEIALQCKVCDCPAEFNEYFMSQVIISEKVVFWSSF